MLKKKISALLFLFALCSSCLHAQTWAPEHQFSTGTGREVKVAADANGNAVAVWQEDGEGTTQFIWAAYFSNGAWGPSVIIGTPPNYQTSPEVAMDASGNALAVWTQSQDGGVWAATFRNGTWGEQTLLSLSAASSLAISMDGTGKGIAAWAVAGSTAIEVALFDGALWGNVASLATTGADPSVAISAAGTALVTWSELITGTPFSSYYNGTTWGTILQVSTEIVQLQTDVGMSAAGIGSIVWSDGDNIFFSQFSGALWSAPLVISTGIGNEFSHLDVQADGKAAAVWLDTFGNVQAALFDGATWASPVIISETASNESPEVGLDGNGNVVAVWGLNDGTTHQIVSAFYYADGINAWQEPWIVTSGALDLFVPDTAFSQSGRAFAVWGNDNELNANFDTFGSFIQAVIPSPALLGRSCKDRFAWQTDCVHLLTWSAITDFPVVSYVLRRNGTVIATIPATGPYAYIDHNRCNQTDVYALSSLGALGQESSPSIVILD